MKLDSIIYDKDTLASTLTQQWLTDSPMFTSMYPSETTTALVNVFAAYGAMIQYCLISAMANCYTDSAFSDRGIYQLAVTLGNSIHGNNSSTVRVKMTKNSLIGVDTNIPAGTQFKINDKLFFNPKEIAFPASLDTVSDIVLLQGERLQANFVTTGTPAERFYFASDFKCNTNQVSVTVNNEVWSVSDSFLDYDKSYITSDKEMNVVVLRTDADGRSYIKLGNNQLGNLPPAGSTVQVTYISNDGSNGNIGEIDAEGKLTSELIYTDGNGNQKNLDVTISTLTTAYGGFDTQSIESLRYTSPYVFASGHRAIRRQDYRAILQSQCGYITSNVWGEYEEAKAAGTYDAIMMNMVYYSGLKSFVNYPYTEIGDLNNRANFVGTIGSTKGLLGSHSIKIVDTTNEAKYTLMQDNHGKGLLFINDNTIDKRDSILPIWKLTTQNTKVYEYAPATENPIISQGSGYRAYDSFKIYTSTNNVTNLSLMIDEVNSNGSVIKFHLQSKYAVQELDLSVPFHIDDSNGSEGFRFKLQLVGTYDKNFITSSNADSTEADAHPISYAMSDEDEAKYFQSNYEPTLLKPVQIKFNFLEANGKSIAAIKFKSSPANDSPFMGSFALFGTNVPDASYENVRNSNKWERIIDKTEVNNPYVEKGRDWTDWYPTNVYTKNSNGSYEFTSYSKYVLEIYSLDSSSASTSNVVSIGKIKILYDSEVSTIEYDNNCNLNLKLPMKGDPGVGDEKGYLISDLFNDIDYKLFKYNVTLDGITTQNGYENGQILGYIPAVNNMFFRIQILDIDNQAFKVSLNNSSSLSGNTNLNLQQYSDVDHYKLCDFDFASIILKDTGETIGKKESDKERILIVGPNTDDKTVLGYVNDDSKVIDFNGQEIGELNVNGNVIANGKNIGKKTNVSKKIAVDESNFVIGYIEQNNDVTTWKDTLTLTANKAALPSEYTRFPIIGKLKADGSISNANYLGTNYKENDELYLSAWDMKQLKLIVSKTNDDGSIAELKWKNNQAMIPTDWLKMIYNESQPQLIHLYGINSHDALIKIKPTTLYGGKNYTTDRKGTITIESESNLGVDVSFKGNKIDTQDINYLDQPMMDKYNHFTTYLEFKQPEVEQIDIMLKVSLSASAYITSDMIKQEITNNVTKLFELKPDSMCKGLKISDIYTAVMKTPNVNWCKVMKPTDNINANRNTVMVLSNLTIREVIEEK